MDDRLNTAAQSGDIDTLYTLLTLDPLLLDHIDASPFSQTPLHVAALAGQTSFLMELLNLKPSLIRKLNTDGYTPIHLASMVGQVELVRELLEYDCALGVVRGREWRIPLHCAVVNGRVDVVRELVSSVWSSEWLKALTVRKESVLHLALKYGQIQVFEMLVDAIKKMDEEEIVNWQDREGNTVLHLAAQTKQFQIIDTLLKRNCLIEVVDKLKNRNDLTAMDILRQHSIDESNNTEIAEIENIFNRIGAGEALDTVVSISTPVPHNLSNPTIPIEPLIMLEELFKGLPMEKWAKEIENSPSKTQSALLVVAVLIATVTFQVALSPPGGFTQGNGNDKMLSALVNGYPVFLVLFSVMNSVGFTTSIAMITVLTRRSPLKALLRIAVLSMVSTFLCCIVYIDTHNPVIVTMVALVMLTVLLFQWIHLKIRSLRKLIIC